jgi:2-oxoglutarate dehydrogenase E2 component (dihydrolipoamide succinyltransferase)
MRIEVLMPKMGESITEGTILSWAKSKGDSVDRDETILEISTDKVDTEVPSPDAGVLVEIFAAEGETVEVGKKIAVIETNGEGSATDSASAEAAPEPSVTEAAPESVAVPVLEDSPVAAAPRLASRPEGKRFYSPVVMRIATDEGIEMSELEALPGSGSNGRITKKDIQEYLKNRGEHDLKPNSQSSGGSRVAATPGTVHSTAAISGSGVELVPMDNMKRLMAEHMVMSVQTSPHVTLVSDVDMTKIVNFRKKHKNAFKAREGISLTYMPFIASATVRALKDFPYINASIDGDTIVLKKSVGLGIAVAMETGGLIVPVIKGAETMNIVGLGRSINDLATRARTKRLQPDEIQDGTFTITNFGVFGNLFGTPIINQPQVAILGIGSINKRPVVVENNGEDTIAIRSMMMLSITFDHRLVDGALGGQFIERVKSYLEEFAMDSI